MTGINGEDTGTSFKCDRGSIFHVHILHTSCPVSDSHQKSDKKTQNPVILHESVKGFITKEFDYFRNLS